MNHVSACGLMLLVHSSLPSLGSDWGSVQLPKRHLTHSTRLVLASVGCREPTVPSMWLESAFMSSIPTACHIPSPDFHPSCHAENQFRIYTIRKLPLCARLDVSLHSRSSQLTCFQYRLSWAGQASCLRLASLRLRRAYLAWPLRKVVLRLGYRLSLLQPTLS